MCLNLLSFIVMSLLVSCVMSQPEQGNVILFNPLVVCYNLLQFFFWIGNFLLNAIVFILLAEVIKL